MADGIVQDTERRHGDYCRTLLKKPNAKIACLCIHRDTNTEFGGWSSCANALIPRGRDHSVRDTFFNDRACVSLDSEPVQKGNAKSAQRLATFRKKDKKTEEEGLRFCHLETTSDHVRRYREVKHELFVEKQSNKVGPQIRLVQFNERHQPKCYLEDISAVDDNVNRYGFKGKLGKVHKFSNFLPMVMYSDNDGEHHVVTLEQSHTGEGNSEILGKAVLFYSDGTDPLARGQSRSNHERIGAATQFTVGEPSVDFPTWVPENAIYQTRCSSSMMYNSVGCLGQERTQHSPSFQPLQPHTSHLRKSKYPPSLIFRDKQDDVITVRNSRNKDGKVRTKVEFLAMTAPDKQSAVIKKQVRYLDPLPTEHEGTGSNPKEVDHDIDDAENQQQKHSFSGRLLYGRMKSGSQRVVIEDHKELAIGKQVDSREEKDTQLQSRYKDRNFMAKKKLYQVEKYDSTQSIPSKSMARSNLCDLQIQPTVGSSLVLLHQESSSNTTVSLNGNDSKLGGMLKDGTHSDGKTTKLTIDTCHYERSGVILNCPTVIDSTLLATPHKSHGDTSEPGRVTSSIMSKQRHSFPDLRKSAQIQHVTVNSHNKLVAKQLNQILLNSSTERFLPSSKHHRRIKISHALTGRRESDTGYRVTLRGSSSADVHHHHHHHHQVKDYSNRCVQRSQQRRKVQLQKNILGNSGFKRVEQNTKPAVTRSYYKKAPQPVKVCLRGTKKRLNDFLRTNSASSIDSELPELLYAE